MHVSVGSVKYVNKDTGNIERKLQCWHDHLTKYVPYLIPEFFRQCSTSLTLRPQILSQHIKQCYKTTSCQQPEVQKQFLYVDSSRTSFFSLFSENSEYRSDPKVSQTFQYSEFSTSEKT